MNNTKLMRKLVGAGITYRRDKSKKEWLLVRTDQDADWEIPKTRVSRKESSVSAVIRMMGEDAGMRAKVLEEVGRSNTGEKINGALVPQSTIYYLVRHMGGEEVLGFSDMKWFLGPQASRVLATAREKNMLKKASEMLGEIEKARKK